MQVCGVPPQSRELELFPGLTFRANFSTAQADGSYEKPVTRGRVTLCVVRQRIPVYPRSLPRGPVSIKKGPSKMPF